MANKRIRNVFFSIPVGLGKRIGQCILIASIGLGLYGGCRYFQYQDEKQLMSITEKLSDKEREEKTDEYTTYFDSHDIDFDGHAVVTTIYLKDKTYGYQIDSFVDPVTKRARKTIILFSTATQQQKGAWEVLIEGYDSDDPIMYEYTMTNKTVTKTEEVDGDTYTVDDEQKDERCIKTHLGTDEDWVEYFAIDQTKLWTGMKDRLTNIDFGENVTQGEENHDLVHFAFNMESFLSGEEGDTKWMQGDLFINTKTNIVDEMLYGEGDTTYYVQDMGTYEIPEIDVDCEIKEVDKDTAMAQYQLDKQSFRILADRGESDTSESAENN